MELELELDSKLELKLELEMELKLELNFQAFSPGLSFRSCRSRITSDLRSLQIFTSEIV